MNYLQENLKNTKLIVQHSLNISYYHTPTDLWKSLWERKQHPKALDHLPLATLPCSPTQCNHCGKKFSRMSSPHIGGPWSRPSLQNTARHIPSQVNGRQVDQLRHLVLHLQDRVQLQGGPKEQRSSAGNWTRRCQGQVCGGIHDVAIWEQCGG